MFRFFYCNSVIYLMTKPNNNRQNNLYLYETIECLNEFLWFPGGMLFFLGRGCECDIDKAYALFKRSYHHEFVQGKLMMEKIEELYMNK